MARVKPKTPAEWAAYKAKFKGISTMPLDIQKGLKIADEKIGDRPPRAWAYGRASTKKQEDSPETQRQKIFDYVTFARQSGYMPEHIGEPTFFVDKATSGKVLWCDREGGKALFSEIRSGDHVIVAKLDRAFRRLVDCVYVMDQFEKMGVKLHICNLMGGAIDLSSPMGRFLIHILAAFAELERAYISERTKDGLANSKKIMKRHCHYAGYGFKWEKRSLNGKVVRVKVRDDEERNVMASIVAWRQGNPPMSWEEIAEHLNVTLGLKTKDNTPWSIPRVRRAWKGELVLQLQEHAGVVIPGHQPPPDKFKPVYKRIKKSEPSPPPA